MIEQNLSRVDLNLLVALSVLLKLRSVSKAADTLYLSQSAMSRTLSRLRETFDDPLFYRTPHGIRPTEKALLLEQQLNHTISQLSQLFEPEKFDPMLCDKAMSISVPSLMSHAVLLPLLNKIHQQSNITLTEYPAKQDALKPLEAGLFDFAFSVIPTQQPHFCCQPLTNIDVTIFARPEHPLCSQQADLDDCLAYPFVDLLIDSEANLTFQNPLQQHLVQQDKARNVIFRTGQLSLLLEMLATSDSLLMGPSILADAAHLRPLLRPVHQYKSKEPMMLYLLQHDRTQNSQAHQWVKNIVLQQFS
ncbi:LysR family transcriptional regulator [Motilimonas pumila]|uniref:LysR family transcriptional regulator n=1 Tax=Motilimonas pumila TaxID=2303987 RepID=A0A418YL31_9GAMM|nr:LysR family transcriptional regulator [Motilimonas pumila]RJG51520.1 LysR family transcriptional regulator [Motilimonas pumila]